MKALSFVFLLSAALSACGSDDKNDFRLNLSQGKVYEFSQDYVARQTEGAMTARFSNEYTVEVTESSANFKTLKFTCGEISVQAKSDKFDLNSDSATAERSRGGSFNPQEALTTMQKALEGKSFYIKINKEGDVVEVSGLKEHILPVLDSINLPEAGKKRAAQAFGVIGEQLMARNFTRGFNIFPNRPIAVGDSWQKEIQGNGFLPAVVLTTYTVKDIRDGKVILQGRSLMEDNNQRGEVIGNYIIDRQSGLILEATIESRFGMPPIVTGTEKITGRVR